MAETVEQVSALVADSAAVQNISKLVATALATPSPPVDAAPSHGIMGWIFHFIASLIMRVTRLFVWALSFATITIPTLIFKILSFSFTLTLNFSSLYFHLSETLTLDYP
jgi:hypothetical protein